MGYFIDLAIFSSEFLQNLPHFLQFFFFIVVNLYHEEEETSVDDTETLEEVLSEYEERRI